MLLRLVGNVEHLTNIQCPLRGTPGFAFVFEVEMVDVLPATSTHLSWRNFVCPVVRSSWVLAIDVDSLPVLRYFYLLVVSHCSCHQQSFGLTQTARLLSSQRPSPRGMATRLTSCAVGSNITTPVPWSCERGLKQFPMVDQGDEISWLLVSRLWSSKGKPGSSCWRGISTGAMKCDRKR